jgi:hypothetical protein
MTTSGTTDFQLDLVEAIEEAFERCGLESRSGYDMRSARRSINVMMLDWANRGLNMWTYEERTQLLTYGVADYDLGADIVDVLENVVQLPPGSASGSNGPTRYSMSRVSISTQATRTNPTVTGRPTEVYYNRGTDGITAHIWPLPGTDGPYTLVYWVLRRIEDAGAFTNTGDFPFRFLPVFIAGLAYYIAQKKRRDDPNLVATLKAEYEEVWQIASQEDREKAVFKQVPRGSSYRVAT